MAKRTYGPKPIFRRKRLSGGAQAIYVKGFTDDTGGRSIEIIITVMMGSHPRILQQEAQRRCDMLNKTWLAYYGIVE